MKKEVLKIENIPAILWGETSNRVYIYVHGKMSNKEEAAGFAAKANQRGYQVLSFDLPEHGERTDENYPCVVWNGVHDLATIGNFAQKCWEGINLFAISLGAYFSLLAYKDLPLKKCLFLSPILDMERLIQNMMTRFNVSAELLEEKREIQTPMGETLNWDYYSYAKENPVNKWNAPTAILYGARDNLTELAIVENFAKRFKCSLTISQGGEHWFHTEQQLALLDEWLDSHMSNNYKK